jgi:radical SAM protein with 4Fe4S-binding SPASM domain
MSAWAWLCRLQRRASLPNGSVSPGFARRGLLLGYLVFAAMYVPLNHWSVGRDAHVLYLPGEERLPFIPEFEFFYMWSYILPLMILWRVADARRLVRLILAFAFTMAVACGTYLLFPVYLERPALAPGSVAAFLLALEYKDPSYNHFPSLHVALAWLVYFACRPAVVHRVAFLLLVLGISVSTVFVKQHYVADVLFGFGLAAAAWTVARRIQDRIDSRPEVPPARPSGYGRPITAPSFLDVACETKNRVMTRLQRPALRAFSWLSERSLGDRLVARVARRLIGGVLYSVKIEVNTACNLACSMCYVARTGADLPRPLIERLLGQLRGRGVRVEILGGEPLLRRDLEGIVASAKISARSPLVSVYTNGVGATRDRAVTLKAAGLDVAIVTLVSHRPEAHDAFVGLAGAWGRTVAGITSFRDAGVDTYTFTPVHSRNQADVRAVHSFATGSLGVHALFYPYVPQRQGDPLMVDPAAWRDIKRWVLLEANPDHGAFVRDFFMLTGSACSGGNFVLTVKVDGSVQPCPFLTDLHLGNVRDESLWTIYRNRFRNPRLVEFKRTPRECEGCSYESVCAGGCRAGNKELFGSYAFRDHRCPGAYSEPLRRAEICDRVPNFF